MRSYAGESGECSIALPCGEDKTKLKGNKLREIVIGHVGSLHPNEIVHALSFLFWRFISYS